MRFKLGIGRRQMVAVLSSLGLFAVTCTASTGLFAEDWTRFLGANGSGLSSSKAAAPTSWSATENMVWKTELPGFGSSSPIILGDTVFLTCYTGYGMDAENPGDLKKLARHLLAFDRKTGTQRWIASVAAEGEEDPYQGFITEHGYCSSTPTTDGERIYVFYGKTGVIAYDLQGKEQWRQKLGDFSDPAKWGDGSSPIVHGDILIVNAGIVGHKIVGLNKKTGEIVWQVENEKFTNSWTTPVLVEAGGRTEAVFSMPDLVMALDPKTGKEFWRAKSPISNTTCPSLASQGDIVYAMGGRGGAAMAVRCGGSGDVTESHVVWNKQMRAGICTPVVAANHLFWATSGIMNAYKCEDGEQQFQERLAAAPAAPAGDGQRRRPGGDYASPVVAGDHLYLVTRNGSSYVVQVGSEFKIVGNGSFGDDTSLFNATPAVVDGQLFVRSNKMLYCIGAK